ncbi:MAG: hypothetical protein LBT46_15265 [Planctomycetaceae bacterium]|jgi:hypothetical protein|nr:hypothetical protein [Planctomycetaceae bacterium]
MSKQTIKPLPCPVCGRIPKLIGTEDLTAFYVCSGKKGRSDHQLFSGTCADKADALQNWNEIVTACKRGKK